MNMFIFVVTFVLFFFLIELLLYSYTYFVLDGGQKVNKKKMFFN